MDKKEIGRKNRKSGADFERRVRANLESKGWIVDKWSNNVEFPKITPFQPTIKTIKITKETPIIPSLKEIIPAIPTPYKIKLRAKLTQAKHKFRCPGIPMAMGTGFPDFVCHRLIKCLATAMGELSYKVIGVEAKSNGYLKPEEKEKCKWLLENNIFSKILIAKKTKVKNKIVVEYKEFK